MSKVRKMTRKAASRKMKAALPLLAKRSAVKRSKEVSRPKDIAMSLTKARKADLKTRPQPISLDAIRDFAILSPREIERFASRKRPRLIQDIMADHTSGDAISTGDVNRLVMALGELRIAALRIGGKFAKIAEEATAEIERVSAHRHTINVKAAREHDRAQQAIMRPDIRNFV